MKKKKSKSEDVAGRIFVGSLMVGIGLGMFLGNTAVGTLIGLGVGFILSGLIKLKIKN